MKHDTWEARWIGERWQTLLTSELCNETRCQDLLLWTKPQLIHR